MTPRYLTCIECQQPFTRKNVYSDLGWKETQISGLCEECFDALFEEIPEDENENGAEE